MAWISIEQEPAGLVRQEAIFLDGIVDLLSGYAPQNYIKPFILLELKFVSAKDAGANAEADGVG